MRFSSILIISILFFNNLKAQESNLGNWWVFFNNVNFKNTKFNWHSEVQYRNYNIAGDLEQLLLRTGIGYNLSDNNNNILLGYGFIQSENYPTISSKKEDKVGVSEHRIFQQFVTKQQFYRFYFQHRCRYEQRFIEDEFKQRFRYSLSLNIAINKKTLEDNTLYFSAYNEIFLNIENEIYDRNRLYSGIGYKLNKNIRFELGYMNQFMNGFSRDQLNVITSLNF